MKKSKKRIVSKSKPSSDVSTRRRMQMLSTNNKNFTSGGRMFADFRTDAVVEGVADEAVRLEKTRSKHHLERQASSFALRTEEVTTELIEESRNGYQITSCTPEDLDEARTHYIDMLRKFTLDFPEEWALCHMSLGKVFMRDLRMLQDRPKTIENSLFHLSTASQVFSAQSFPVTWAVICLLTSAVHRERAQMIFNREFTSGRGTVGDSLKAGVEAAENALNVFSTISHRYTIEQSASRFILGWLLYMSAVLEEDTITASQQEQYLERAIGQWEKCLSLFEQLIARGRQLLPPIAFKPKARTSGALNILQSHEQLAEDQSYSTATIADEYDTHPKHVQLVFQERSLTYMTGLCKCLLGGAYFYLRSDHRTMTIAYENLSEAVKPKYQLKESVHWVDAHYFLASLSLRDPSLLDVRPSSATTDRTQVDQIHIEIALSHISLAIASAAAKRRITDLHFLAAEANFSRLYSVTDKSINPASLNTVMSDGSSAGDVVREAEERYIAALKRVSSVSTIGTEAFVFYFSSLKLAELRIIQAVAVNQQRARGQNLPAEKVREREYLYESAMKYLLDALQARSPEENVDLHYLSGNQMSYLLSVGSKRSVSLRCYVRTLLCLSCLINRTKYMLIEDDLSSAKPRLTKKASMYRPVSATIRPKSAASGRPKNAVANKHVTLDNPSMRSLSKYGVDTLRREAERLVSMTLLCSMKEIKWVKDSHEAVDGNQRFSLWSFEEKDDNDGPPSIQRANTNIAITSLGGEVSTSAARPQLKRVPTLPLDPLPKLGTSKNYDEGAVMKQSDDVRVTPSVADVAADGSVAEDRDGSLSLLAASPLTQLTPARTPLYMKQNFPQNIDPESIPTAPSHIKPPKLPVMEGEIPSPSRSITTMNAEILQARALQGLSKADLKRVQNRDIFDDEALPDLPVKKVKPPGLLAKLKDVFKKKPAGKRSASAPSSKILKNVLSKDALIPLQVYATSHSIFCLNLLCQWSRQRMCLISQKLQVSRGVRVRQALKSPYISEAALQQLKKIQTSLQSATNEIVPSPWTLTELGQCSNFDLKKIFRSQGKISNMMITEEKCFSNLYGGHSKADLFLELTLSLPSYKTVINGEGLDDEGLLSHENVFRKASQTATPTRPASAIKRTTSSVSTERGHQGREKVTNSHPYERFTPWLTCLDASYARIDHTLATHLMQCEAMIHWHVVGTVPSKSTQHYPLQAAIIWKGEPTSQALRDNLKKNNFRATSTSNNMGEVLCVEYGKSDVTLAQLHHSVEAFTEALHSRPPPIRATKCQEALSLMSDAFMIWELLKKLPKYISSIIICCPPSMMTVPWHLLYVNAPGDPQQHFIDEYTVRLSSSLSFFELNASKAQTLSHAPGMHKLCVIDAASSEETAGTLFLGDIETRSVTSLWSSDPWDYTVLEKHHAASSEIVTKFESKRAAPQKPLFGKHRDKFNALISETRKNIDEKVIAAKKYKTSSSTPTDDGAAAALTTEVDESINEDVEDSFEDESEDEAEIAYRNSQALASCRVLHICASKGNAPSPQSGSDLAICLPRSKRSKSNSDADISYLSARQVATHLYLKNCSLCVLSRMGVLDPVVSSSGAPAPVSEKTIGSIYEMVEALHLAGASTVLFPLWSGGSLGGDISQICRLIMTLRFYFELPRQANQPRPIPHALRMTQKWLRAATVKDILNFLKESPIDDECELTLVDDIRGLESARHMRGGNEQFEDSKLFSHFFYWGLMICYGDGSAVHPPGVGGQDAPPVVSIVQPTDGISAVINNALSVEIDDDEYLENEARLLRMEGGIEEAEAVETELRRRRQEKIDKQKQKLLEATDTGIGTMKEAARRTSVMLAKGSLAISDAASKAAVAYKQHQDATKTHPDSKNIDSNDKPRNTSAACTVM